MIPAMRRVEIELASLEEEAAAFMESMAAVTAEEIKGRLGVLLVQGMASSIEKLYSGFERAMVFVARDIDKDPVDKGEHWHKHLLQRMGSPYGGIRPAVLNPDLCVSLDDLRAFRHRERNTYGQHLDAPIVTEFAENCLETLKLFKAAMKHLSETLATQAEVVAEADSPKS